MKLGIEVNAIEHIEKNIHDEILERIAAAEVEHDVKVLLAIESGSRAWGFASATSDYDVRFIYIHKKDWYIDIDLEAKRDVIEYPIVDEIDINGWDLRKALKLYSNSNPSFVEWITSPIVYTCEGNFALSAKALLPEIYSAEKGIHHYRSMAKTNYRGYLKADKVPYKKYLYVLRALLSIRWLERYNTPAPIQFSVLLDHVLDNDSLLENINELLRRKRAETEKALSLPIKPINTFIETELLRLESYAGKYGDKGDSIDLLNSLFHRVLNESIHYFD
jgi:predicted nucleotidyltransferase